MSDLLTRLTNIFRATFGDESIVLEDAMTADDIDDWDSVTHITLILSVEEEYGITLSTDELEGVQNVGDLREAIARHL